MRPDPRRDIFDYRWRQLPAHELIAAIVAQHQPRSYMEIGFFRGGSLQAVLRSARQLTRVVVCDLFGGHFGGATDPGVARRLATAIGYTGEFVTLQGDSRRVVPDYLSTDRDIDLAFIDGDHNFEPAYHDIAAVVPCARLTLVHDLDHWTVWEAFRTYVQAHPALRFWIVGDSQGTGVIYREAA